jgi:phosphoribosylformylglycinamidine synthase
MAVTFGIIVFPGSNCDHDAYHAVKHVVGEQARFIWHKDASLKDVDAVLIPGGFSYGDYLRSGAIARFSPIMQDVIRFAADGGLVLGICNGFQILCEAGLLPGGLLRNRSLRFVCKSVHLRVENANTAFTHRLTRGDVLEIPVAHGDGNYYASEDVLDRLESEGRVVLRYTNAQGIVTGDANPNGAARNIAGIINAEGNVLGMMPHPERHVESLVGSMDGLPIFQSMVSSLVGTLAPASL